MSETSAPSPISDVPDTSAPGAVCPNNESYLQKPLATGVSTQWQVPQVLKYEQSNAKNIPRAARVHALAMNCIEKHWNKDVASGCLPPELGKRTPYSLALLTRLDTLANFTREDHDRGVKLLLEAIERRRARDAANNCPTLAEDVRTNPARIRMQSKVKTVEAEITENRQGVMLEDVNAAVQEALKPAKSARCAKAPDETKESMQARIEQKDQKKTKNLASVVREVALLGMHRSEEFKVIESRLGQKLKREQRRTVTRMRKALYSSARRHISYSTAASGPHGNIINVNGLDSSLDKMDIAEWPGLSDEGKEFLEGNEISSASSDESTNTRDLDRMADQEPAKSSGSFQARPDGNALSTAMSNVSISPSAGPEGYEPCSKGELFLSLFKSNQLKGVEGVAWGQT